MFKIDLLISSSFCSAVTRYIVLCCRVMIGQRCRKKAGNFEFELGLGVGVGLNLKLNLKLNSSKSATVLLKLHFSEPAVCVVVVV